LVYDIDGTKDVEPNVAKALSIIKGEHPKPTAQEAGSGDLDEPIPAGE
jgi:hypothetical protein